MCIRDRSYGSAKIVKTSEDGKVDGISFRIQGNGIDKTVKTGNGGQIQVCLLYTSMLISAVHHEEGEEKLHLLMVDDHIPAGAKLYYCLLYTSRHHIIVPLTTMGGS